MMIRALLAFLLLAASAHAETFTPEQFGGKPGVDSTAALQQAFDAAAKAGGEVYLSAGTWRGNVAISNVEGMTIRGDSKNRTFLQAIDAKPALRIEGFWYSTIRDLGFRTDRGIPNAGVLEIDSGKERGVQGNTYSNVFVNGQGLNDGQKSKYAMTMCRVGGNSAQGSEQMFLNCHFTGASQACYYQLGFNALNTVFVGGNFQNYTRNGIELVFGSMHILSVGFQSTAGFDQVKNDGWDIKADSGGVSDGLTIIGCRTESARFFKGCASQPAAIQNCLQLPGFDTKGLDFVVVDMPVGTIHNCTWNAGQVKQEHDADNPGKQVQGDYTVTTDERWVFVDAKKDTTITLCNPAEVPHGHTVTVVKAGGSKGEVCVFSLFLDNMPIHNCRVTTSAQFMALGGGTSPRRFYRVQ